MSYTLINPATEEQMETIAHADLAQTNALDAMNVQVEVHLFLLS
jgi:hypothetical protein